MARVKRGWPEEMTSKLKTEGCSRSLLMNNGIESCYSRENKWHMQRPQDSKSFEAGGN
jgi:hypothetical protein